MIGTQPYEHLWRGRATFVASKLDRARSAVEALGDAFDEDDGAKTRRRYRSARDEIASIAAEVNGMRSEQLAVDEMEQSTATGSTLVIRGTGAATIALDVMVDALAALGSAEEVDDVDVLIGACIDGHQAFEDCAAVVKAAAKAHGTSLSNLERAFNTEGEVALRKRVSEARRKVHNVNARVTNQVPTKTTRTRNKPDKRAG